MDKIINKGTKLKTSTVRWQ